MTGIARMKKKLFDLRVVIATHVYGTGASQDLLQYFIDHKVGKTLFIGHPLFYDKHLKGSGFELYSNGLLIRKEYSRNHNIPIFLGFILHAVKNLVWSIVKGSRWDIYIGSNNLNAYTGLILKKLGFVTHVVYYVIDYNPKRYGNPIMNYLYHKLDQYCVLNSDETWNLSPRMEQGRKIYFGFTGGNQKVVPVGMWKEAMVRIPFSKINKYRVVFLGHILKKQGVQHIIDAIPEIKKKIREFTLLVMGDGEYLDNLKRQVQALDLENTVEFTGYIPDHTIIEKKLSNCALGIALYKRMDENNLNFSYFGSPTKVKTYLASGLPVMITDVPYNASELVRKGCARITTTNSHDIAVNLISILSNPKILGTMRDKVVRYRRKFDWNVIFTKALDAMI